METNKALEIINGFVENRPQSLGAYGYGSGVFKQTGYDGKVRPQIDIIFLVDDLREWHQENLRMNKSDYSLMGRIHLNTSSISRLKGYNGITYYSNIYENDFRFKYGVMEERDFVVNLHTWQNFFIAGRFQKPVLKLKGTEREDKAIIENRKSALLVSALVSFKESSIPDFLETICTFSYYGAPRMGIAENPNKVHNIVSGSFERLINLYNFNVDYVTLVDGDKLLIDHDKAIRHVKELPLSLLAYLYENKVDITKLSAVRNGIIQFFSMHNKVEELHQSVEGIKTNGIVRSVPYLLAKVKKRITK